MNQKFIQTQDAPTATLLSQLGYQQVQNSNGIYVFLNTDTLRFSENIDINKLKYTNMLPWATSIMSERRKRLSRCQRLLKRKF